MARTLLRAFTLVEILIVVLILGILAALVVPMFSKATAEAQAGAAIESLGRTRRAVQVYYVRNGNSPPSITPGAVLANWGELATTGVLKEPPVNPWVGSAASTTVTFGSGPDPGYQMVHGWIYDASTADLWAGSFDAQDQPYPRP